MTELVRIRKTCRLCGSADLLRSVPLAEVPIVSPNVATGARGDGSRIARVTAPLDNYLCRDCGLIQLVHIVDPSIIYRNYLYRTAVSMGLAKHFRGMANIAIERTGLVAGDLVLEFGSNDGTLLGFFRDADMRVQGVDPARGIAEEASARGVPTRADFFGEALAVELRGELGPARAVIANNAMANIDDLADILRGVETILAPDGVFVFETQYALDVFEKTLLDVIYHEHISCFSVRPIDAAIGRHGLEIIDAERIDTKGGSIRFWLQRKGGPRARAARVDELVALEEKTGLYDPAYHRAFGDRVAAIKVELRGLTDAARAKGRTVGGYGASVGCAALIHQFELEARLDCLFDDAPFKERLEGPGYDLPVYPGDDLFAVEPGLVIILAWRYAEPIMAKHRKYLAKGGRFVVPLPRIEVFP